MTRSWGHKCGAWELCVNQSCDHLHEVTRHHLKVFTWKRKTPMQLGLVTRWCITTGGTMLVFQCKTKKVVLYTNHADTLTHWTAGFTLGRAYYQIPGNAQGPPQVSINKKLWNSTQTKFSFQFPGSFGSLCPRGWLCIPSIPFYSLI